MKPKRIILIRHGESEGNVDENVYSVKPDYKLDLTSKGLEQAEKCGINLRKITKNESCFFYVSPLFRTMWTNEDVGHHKESCNGLEGDNISSKF